MLQRCVVLKIVVTNHLVKHHLLVPKWSFCPDKEFGIWTFHGFQARVVWFLVNFAMISPLFYTLLPLIGQQKLNNLKMYNNLVELC